MGNLFSKYVQFREEQQEKSVEGVTSHIKLQAKQGSNQFTPFVIDKNNHANLARIVKAFNNSEKVGLGYTTIEKNKGEVRPHIKKKNIYLTGEIGRAHV